MEKLYKSYGVMGTMSGEEVKCTGIHKVLRDIVRFIFNRTEGKLEVAILKDYESIRMVSKPPLLKFIQLQLDNWSKY
jgi:hypothetical protein